LVNRYVKNAFQPAQTPSTVGASFVTKRVTDDDTDTTVRLQIWDTAGQERFRSISKLYYRGANAGVLCYDITDEESFKEMGGWLLELKKNLGDDVILHVVGTKTDLVQENPSLRAVPFERCIAYVAENLYPSLNSTPPSTGLSGSKRNSGFWGQDIGWDTCHEISAKDGEGIEEVFRVLTRKLVEQHNKKLVKDKDNAIPDAGKNGNFEGRGMDGAGSFKLGHGDRRKSWLGIGGVGPPLGPARTDSQRVAGQDLDTEPRRRGGCC
jgi:small GTP-binding protein